MKAWHQWKKFVPEIKVELPPASQTHAVAVFASVEDAAVEHVAFVDNVFAPASSMLLDSASAAEKQDVCNGWAQKEYVRTVAAAMEDWNRFRMVDIETAVSSRSAGKASKGI